MPDIPNQNSMHFTSIQTIDNFVVSLNRDEKVLFEQKNLRFSPKFEINSENSNKFSNVSFITLSEPVRANANEGSCFASF